MSSTPRRSLFRAGRWLLNHAGQAALVTLVGLAVVWGVTKLTEDEPRSISQQLDSVLTDAAREGLFPVVNRRVDLRGTGSRARLIVLRPRRRQSIERSDEIRVYDEIRGRLELGLSVRPVTKIRHVLAFRIDPVTIGRFDQSDRQQAILTLLPMYADTNAPFPVAVTWNVTQAAYQVVSLLPQTPKLPRVRRRGRGLSTPEGFTALLISR